MDGTQGTEAMEVDSGAGFALFQSVILWNDHVEKALTLGHIGEKRTDLFIGKH